jgi:uncharacterized membrane protein YkvA (DUF1232 family)
VVTSVAPPPTRDRDRVGYAIERDREAGLAGSGEHWLPWRRAVIVMSMPPKLRRHTALVALVRAFRPPGVGRRLAAFPRMIKATLSGKYDGGVRLLLMAAASLYIVSPIDAIPELFTAFIGLIDDAFVATWLAGALLAETDRFLEWERRNTVLPAQVIRRSAADRLG